MINLQELERKLHEQLEKETTESLTQWLLSKRYKGYSEILGSGTFEDLEKKHVTFEGNLENSSITNYLSDSQQFTSSNNNFALAA